MLKYIPIGLIAEVISFTAYIPYAISTLKKQTQPNRATWLVWAIGSWTLVASSWVLGARNTIWVFLAYALGQSTIAILAIKLGQAKWLILDKICFCLALTGIIIWIAFNSPAIALIMSMVVSFLGLVPTLIKAWHHPETENSTAWALFQIGNSLNLLAINRFIWTIAVCPIYHFFASGSIFLAVFRKNIKNHFKILLFR